MIKGSKKVGSLRYYSEKYGVSHETIKRFKEEGIDLEDAERVKARIESSSVEFTPTSIPDENTVPGLRAAIDRLRAAEVAAHTSYVHSLKTNPRASQAALKAWREILEQLRKIEGENPDIEQANNQSISRAELAETLGELFRNLRLDLDSLPRKFANLTEGKNKIQRERIAEEEVNRILDALSSCRLLKHEG